MQSYNPKSSLDHSRSKVGVAIRWTTADVDATIDGIIAPPVESDDCDIGVDVPGVADLALGCIPGVGIVVVIASIVQDNNSQC